MAKKHRTVVSSFSQAVEIGGKPVIIGERINPTGKSKFKAALREGNIEYILSEGLTQEDSGAHILDVNVGLPEIDEAAMMEQVVTAAAKRARPAAPDRHLEYRGDGARHAPVQRQADDQFGQRQAGEHGSGVPAGEKVRRRGRRPDAGRKRHPGYRRGPRADRKEDLRHRRAVRHRQGGYRDRRR